MENESIGPILFDVDDTLFDRKRVQLRILRMIVRRMRGLFSGLTQKEVQEAFFASDREASKRLDESPSVGAARMERWEIFLASIGREARWADRINRLYMDLYPKVVIPVKGARRVVRALSRRRRLAVVSNGFADIQYRKLERLGILAFFECVVLSDEIGIRKPDPRIFLRAVEILGEEPSRCLYVGDSYEYDMAGAKSAGLLACWLNPLGARLPPGSVRPDHEIGRLIDIFEIAGR